MSICLAVMLKDPNTSAEIPEQIFLRKIIHATI